MNQPDYIGDDLEALAAMRRYQDWIVESFLPAIKGRTVEYGAGLGTFSAQFLPHVDRLDLVEPSPTLIERLQFRFLGEKKVNIQEMSLESHVSTSHGASFDTAIMINVLEHIADDAGALAGIRRLLVPGGHLLIFVPALEWLFSDLDRLVGHYRRYRLKNLVELVQNAGFEVRCARYMDSLGILPWWLLNTICRSTSFNPRLVLLYDRIGVPLTRRIESIMTPPLGKNVILTAIRRADAPRPVAGRP